MTETTLVDVLDHVLTVVQLIQRDFHGQITLGFAEMFQQKSE